MGIGDFIIGFSRVLLRREKLETVITNTEVLQGGGGKAPRTEAVIINTEVLQGGGGKAPRSETVLTGTVVLALGSL